jgi:hypothetical protein
MGRLCRLSAAGPAAVLAGLALLAACGKRGDPLPPFPKTPQPVAGLALAQRGDGLIVTYEVPRLTTAGQRLPVLDVELQRADAEGDFGKIAQKSRTRVAPGEAVETRLPLPPPGTEVRVAVRAISSGQASTLTPVVTLTSRPPPPPPRGLAARLTEDGVALSWTVPDMPASPSPSPAPAAASPSPPAASPSPAAASPSPPADAPHAPAVSPAPSPSPAPGTPASPSSPSPSPTPTPTPTPPPPPGTWIYRREQGGSYARPLNPAPVSHPTGSYADDAARPGQELCYVVRTVVSREPKVESEESNEACLAVRDVKAPKAPSGLTALAREGAIELSWSPVSDPDVAHLRVYRSLAEGPPERLAELAPTETSYRDAGGSPASSYSLTAVDAAGNESPHSRAAEVVIP